ncbi:MAG TPA: GNAT family N-acetyltransferase [Minicystis sp.]|nr:GNAT family N-acetyltransferase [Minicystis sp.]
MDARARLQQKATTAAEAIRRIGPGRRIFIGSGAAEPGRLVEALVEHGDHLVDNEILHILTLGPAPYVRPGLERRFRHRAFFIGDNVRDAVQAGRADFVPIFLHELPRLLRSPRARVDVALVQVSAPDAHGFVSLGVSVDVVRAALESATLVIAEVNPRMPRTHGDSFVSIDRLDAVVFVDAPLPERTCGELDDVDRAIGHHVATLVPDGATLQTGIGRIPDAVLAALADRRDLGVHSEMISDGMMKLAEAGVVTGAKKTLLPGKIVTSFLLGSRALYAWAHDNPALELRPSDFTNDPAIIAENERMIAINGALAVDLTGQVAADTLLGKFFSGIGGQVDFVRGAARSRGGRPIIALRSTAKDGAVSRIQPAFEAGAGIVTSRGDVHFVVTEFGVADLWGKSVRERALALVEIAHPDHRADLIAAAKARRYVFADQPSPRLRSAWERADVERLPDGEPVLVRPALPSDAAGLKWLAWALRDASERRLIPKQPDGGGLDVDRVLDVDGETSIALVVCAGPDFETLAAFARADVVEKGKNAKMNLIVREDMRRRGIGTVILRAMRRAAGARGAAALECEIPDEDRGTLRVFQKSGLIRDVLEKGVHNVVACI